MKKPLLVLLLLIVGLVECRSQEPRQLRIEVFPPETEIRAFFPSSPPNGDLLPNNQTVLLRDAGLTLTVRLSAAGFEDKVEEIKLIQTNMTGPSLWEFKTRLRPESPTAYARLQWHLYPRRVLGGITLILIGGLGFIGVSRKRAYRGKAYQRKLMEQTATEVRELRERLKLNPTSIEGLELDNYTVGEKIGEGAFSKVYRALHKELGEEVAIKLLNFEEADKESLARLKREIDIGATLNHPNIVQTLAFGSFGNYPYVVSEFISGDTLHQRLKSVRLEIPQALQLFAQMVEGISHAHKKNVIHRDLKPANMLVTEGDQIKILDFGLAKLLGASQKLTKTGQAMGTPIYMSPEQLRGQISRESDYYSLGCILFEMLTGRPPFVKDQPMQILSAHAFEKPQRVTELAPEVPHHIAEMIDAMLKKKPSERLADPDVILKTLREKLA